MQSGEFDKFVAPSPRLSFIEQTGEVEISFDQDMHVVPDVSMITDGRVKINGTEYPIVQIQVVNGPDSDPKNLGFSWVTS